MAPDASAAKAGRGLANIRQWVSLGSNARALWGECQGSAQAPYQTQVDLSEPAFHCTCPSRKFPCKHSLGLFLLYAEHGDVFEHPAPPPWVAVWLSQRDEKTSKRTRPADANADPPDPAAPARKTAAQTKRAAQRADRVGVGIQEVELWLRDLVRQGLAAAQSQPPRYWETIAARMVDAQAPGIARWLREMSSLPASGEGWAERLLERIGLLHLLIESYKRIDQLPTATQADARAAIGFTLKQEEVLAQQEGMPDTWQVLGQHSYEEERLRVQRTWLRGLRSGRDALVLDFAFGNQLLDTSLLPGTQFDGELVYYPGNYPLRAAVKERFAETVALKHLPAYPDAASGLSAYAGALGRNPWLEAFPLGIASAIPSYQAGEWHVRDTANAHRIPPAASFTGGWQLMALSGGQPIALFGEWDGHAFLPLSAWAEGRFVRL
jgi:hypothetical protein